MINLKKRLNYLLLFSFTFCFLNSVNSENFYDENVKSSFVPANDSMPLRYNYSLDFLKEESDCWNLDTSLKYRFQKSFNDKKIAAMIFGSNILNASNPSVRSNQLDNEIYSGTFGFDTDVKTNDSLKVGIKNHYIDLFFNLQIPNSNFYLNFGIPIQNNIIKVCNDEKVYNGAVSTTTLNSLKKYLSGSTVGHMQTRKFGILKQNCSTNCWNIAGIPIQVGWNEFKRENSHLGFYLRTVLPTGSKLDSSWAKYTLTPFVGPKSWEVDLGFNSHIDVFEKEKLNMRLDLDGYVGHIFSRKDYRTFDLKQGILTRYATAKSFDTNLNYLDKSYWVADLTTQQVNVSVPLKTELVLNSVFYNDNYEFNFGYSFKGQQKESSNCNPKIKNDFIYGLAQQINSTDLSVPTITPYSGMFLVNYSDLNLDGDGKVIGYGSSITTKNSLSDSDINIESGLMNSQTSNIIFGGYKHKFDFMDNDIYFGINGSVSLSSKKSFSPEMWDVGIYLETQF